MRILIADDDLTSRAALTAVLKKHGHRVVVTRDGAEAWAALEQPDAPRLLVLDWLMPGLNGIELCRRIRGIDTDRPPYILLLTGLSDKEHMAEGLDAGANDYLAKPFEIVELRARIAVGERMLAMQDRLVAQAEELRAALGQIKTLRGIIPICAYCKRVRDDQDYWSKVEVYLAAHTDATFTHGLCPECADKHFPQKPKE